MPFTSLRPRKRRSAHQPARAVYRESSGGLGDLSAVAERIAALIDGPVTEALVVLLTDLYGDALTRILAAIGSAPAGEEIMQRLCDDQLVGGLLVVHDLHPLPLVTRVERAVASLDVSAANSPAIRLDRIEDDVAYVRLSAAAQPATRTAIAHAIAAAAPEISRVCTDVDVEVLRSP